MRFVSLGSGSRGNATLVESNHCCLLVDCGYSARELEKRMLRAGRSAADLSAILVTHEHSDHISGVAVVARRYNIPVYASHGTARHRTLRDLAQLHRIDLQQPFRVADVQVTPVAVPHDASEPCQFVFCSAKKTVGLLTDLGSITPFVIAHYRDCDALLLECNHDLELLARGPYPPSLKQRVGGAWGHLSNRQAAQLLGHIDLARLQHLVVAHISEQNNSYGHVNDALEAVLVGERDWVFADQQDGTDWFEVL